MTRKKSSKAGGWRNRIVGHGEVDPRTLKANPLNWRRHPEEQKSALTAVLGEIGWVGGVLVNKTTGLVVDGHARLDAALKKKERSVPVDYVELTPQEERTILAVLDPIGEMAESDDERMEKLRREIEGDGGDLDSILGSLGENEEGKSSGVREVETSEVRDEFWISINGPLEHQAKVLQALRAATEGLDGVHVEQGTIDDGG